MTNRLRMEWERPKFCSCIVVPNRSPEGCGCLEEKQREVPAVFISGTDLLRPALWKYLTHLRVVGEAEVNFGDQWMKAVDGEFIHSSSSKSVLDRKFISQKLGTYSTYRGLKIVLCA